MKFALNLEPSNCHWHTEQAHAGPGQGQKRESAAAGGRGLRLTRASDGAVLGIKPGESARSACAGRYQ